MNATRRKLHSPSEVNLAFSSVLRELRLQRGFSQEALAFESGVHRTFVSQLERGIKTPSLQTVIKLAAALGTSLGEFVTLVEQRLSRPR